MRELNGGGGEMLAKSCCLLDAMICELRIARASTATGE
jgi:hypothetical protein